MSEWISVKARLPDENTEVLVFNNNFGVSRYRAAHIAAEWWDGDCTWFGVTHWMPLPARPEEPNQCRWCDEGRPFMPGQVGLQHVPLYAGGDHGGAMCHNSHIYTSNHLVFDTREGSSESGRAEPATQREEVSRDTQREEASEMEGMPDCVKCGHPALNHDDEFGNCTALPSRYGMNQRDGCDCPGYAELEGEPMEENKSAAQINGEIMEAWRRGEQSPYAKAPATQRERCPKCNVRNGHLESCPLIEITQREEA